VSYGEHVLTVSVSLDSLVTRSTRGEAKPTVNSHRARRQILVIERAFEPHRSRRAGSTLAEQGHVPGGGPARADAYVDSEATWLTA